ncbi:glycosyltransferase involved in cell wall biosynthesis [Lutibacter sp. Hel_I_33_5]|uniref:glycosyltransferase family 4 protein n=1 Tax=Lutibacter sp. Hel_I_33_5 TaxID=1566289 RepID=UPI0011A56D2F|nr:glycosyltransferase family 4 protein [Lutibacter sp. Hel_I_33_5]TVZ54866.1 glycosyltransferase involved in cell wall biosynthesis [Lutibacter sp. Hel_I_33_5]
MNIAYITSEYSYNNEVNNIGGIASFIRNLSVNLLLLGHTVYIFLYSQNRNEIIEYEGVIIYKIKLKSFKGFTWLTNRLYFNKYINRIIYEKKIEILETPEWTGFTAFMKFKVPLVIRLHGSDTYFCSLEKRKVKFQNKFFEKRALQNADAIIGVSNFVSQQTKEIFKLDKKIITIYNAIDVKRFKPNYQEIIPKSLLYFGTIARKKGVLEIAKIFNKVIEKDETIRLFFLGRDNKDYLSGTSTLRMFKDLLSIKARENFFYKNAVPYNEVKKLINKAEVIILPSFAEALPMTWLEAMAMEKAIVTSNIGWANEIMIDGETGFTCNPKEHENYANKVINLFNDKSLAKKMSKKARLRIVSSFNQKIIFEKNYEFYKQLIRNEV